MTSLICIEYPSFNTYISELYSVSLGKEKMVSEYLYYIHSAQKVIGGSWCYRLHWSCTLCKMADNTKMLCAPWQVRIAFCICKWLFALMNISLESSQVKVDAVHYCE